MGWKDNRAAWMRQQRLLLDHPECNLDLMKNANSPLERHAVSWCAENFLPLKQIRQATFPMHQISYEDLVCQPEQTLAQLLEFVGCSNTRQEVLIRKIMKRQRPSPESLHKWKTQLSPEEIKFILRTCDQFGITGYSDSF